MKGVMIQAETRATIDMRIVDVETTEVRLAMRESGVASDSSGGIIYKDGGIGQVE